MSAVDTVRNVLGRLPRRRAAMLAAVGVGVLAGCAEDAPQDTWDPAGPNAQKIHDLQWPVFAVAGLVLVIVMVAVGYAVSRFKDRGQPIPKQTHGKPALEIGLTILPAIILIGVAVPTVGTLMALSKTSDTECVVNVTGQQWWWEMDYPVQEGCGGFDQPIITSGQLVIPTGTKVLVRGTSRDVIHSWWIPRLNGKRDFVPGRVQTVRLEADEPGMYAGQCTEFCGLSHANMRMEVVALDSSDFETWKANQLSEYQAPEEGSLAAQGEEVFRAQCASCHQVDGLTDADGNPVIAAPETRVYAGAAPNLTHLMSRTTFAGATWDLVTPECRQRVWEATPEEFGQAYLEGVSRECLNEIDLADWLRNAPEKKPMYADAEDLGPTGGLTRGMPNLQLSDEQVNQLIAYLLTRQ